jgi:hypothetical protein
MPGERDQAIRELVAEWMHRARSDFELAQMIGEVPGSSLCSRMNRDLPALSMLTLRSPGEG